MTDSLDLPKCLSQPALRVRIAVYLHVKISTYWVVVVGGTESLGITAGETKNPSKNMPRVVKMVFWRYVRLLVKYRDNTLMFLQDSILLCLEHSAHWA